MHCFSLHYNYNNSESLAWVQSAVLTWEFLLLPVLIDIGTGMHALCLSLIIFPLMATVTLIVVAA